MSETVLIPINGTAETFPVPESMSISLRTWVSEMAARYWIEAPAPHGLRSRILTAQQFDHAADGVYRQLLWRRTGGTDSAPDDRPTSTWTGSGVENDMPAPPTGGDAWFACDVHHAGYVVRTRVTDGTRTFLWADSVGPSGELNHLSFGHGWIEEMTDELA